MTTERLQIIIDALYEAGDELKRMRNDIEGVNEAQGTNERKSVSMQEQWRNIAVTAGVVTGALYTLKKAYDFTEQGAQVERLATSGQRLADQYGESMPRITSAIQSASGATIDKMSAMSAANQAMQLGVAQTPEEFEKLTKAAVALGRATGRTATESIQDLTTGVGRQSKLILDNLGITYDANQLYNEYAESVGKVASQLTDAEKKQALLNAALEAAQPLLDENGDLIDDQATQYERLSTHWKDLTAQWKRRGAGIVAPAMKQAGEMAAAYNELDAALQQNIITEKEYNRLRRRVKFHIADQTDVTERLTRRTDDLSASAAVASKRLEDQRFSMQYAREVALNSEVPMEILARKLEGISDSARLAALDMEGYAESIENAISLRDSIMDVNEEIDVMLTPALAASRAERIEKFGGMMQGLTVGMTGTFTPIEMQRLALGETLEGGGESVMSIQAGDTLSAFAERFDTSVQALMGINPKIDDPNLIYAGEQLNVPLDNARKNIEAMNEGITTITSRQHNININMNVTSDDVSPGVVNSLTEKMMERYGDLQ